MISGPLPQQLQQDFGLIDEGDEDAVKRLKAAYIAGKRDPPPLSPSSSNPPAEDAATPAGPSDYADSALEDASFMLTYSEFVGALLRLGIGGKYDDPSLGLSARLLGTISLVIHAVTNSHLSSTSSAATTTTSSASLGATSSNALA